MITMNEFCPLFSPAQRVIPLDTVKQYCWLQFFLQLFQLQISNVIHNVSDSIPLYICQMHLWLRYPSTGGAYYMRGFKAMFIP